MVVVSESHPALEELIGAAVKKEGTVVEYDLSRADLSTLGASYVPKHFVLSQFKPFSQYPFVLRDIALWVGEGTEADHVAHTVSEAAGSLLLSCTLFDTFSKEGRVSYAFRLVFQSMDRTLTDDEVSLCMTNVSKVVSEHNWEVR